MKTCTSPRNYAQLEFSTSAAKRRADQIFTAFATFHQENPKVWELFEKFTLEAINAGRECYSANAIFERIRWHVDIETSGEVKLNNNFRAYYARMFHATHRDHCEFFRNRRRTSEDDGAHERDIQVFHGAKPGDEADLLKKLVALSTGKPELPQTESAS